MLCSDSSVVLLSVYTVVTLSTLFSKSVCTYSSALSITNISALLLVHLMSILYIISTVAVPVFIMAIPSPTPCSDLFPSV